MPVKVAEDDMRIELDAVYVMPQNAILTIEDTRLRLHTSNVQNRERKPIDVFFSTSPRTRVPISEAALLEPVRQLLAAAK